MRKCILAVLSPFCFCVSATVQQLTLTCDQIKTMTPEWKGERFADGRPKVPDNIVQRMKSVSVEEAWAVMKNAGYGYQVAEG